MSLARRIGPQLATCKSKIDDELETRLVSFQTAILLVPHPGLWRLDTVAYFGRCLWVGPTMATRRLQPRFTGERGQVEPWTRTQARAAPQAFICKRDSGSDRFAILWNVRRSLPLAPTVRLVKLLFFKHSFFYIHSIFPDYAMYVMLMMLVSRIN